MVKPIWECGKGHRVCRAAPERKPRGGELLRITVGGVAVFVFDRIAHHIAEMSAKIGEAKHEINTTRCGAARLQRRRRLSAHAGGTEIIVLL